MSVVRFVLAGTRSPINRLTSPSERDAKRAIFVGGSTCSRLLAPSNSFPVSRSSSTVSNSKSKIGDAIVKLHSAQLGTSTVSTLKPSLQGSSFPPTKKKKKKKKKKSLLWSGNLSPPGRAAIGKSQPVQLRRSLVMAMATARWHVRKSRAAPEYVLIPKLQTADTTRSTKLHRPRRLRPSSNTQRMPPPLQSLRLRPRSLSPANIPNNGQQTPWPCCFTRTPNQTCRRQTALRLLTIEPNRLLYRPQFRPRPWRWPPPPRHKLHLPSTTHDRLVAAAVKPPRSWPTAYQHRIPRRWTETTTPSAIPCKRQDINRVRVSSLTRAIDSCLLSLSVSPSLLFPLYSHPKWDFFAWGVSLRHVTSANHISTCSAHSYLFLYST